MADRYDDFERSSQGHRGDWREDRGGHDRGDFGREDWDRNRNRGNWGGDQERYGRGQWSNYDQERYGGRGDQFRGGQQRYNEQGFGGREEHEYQPRGSAWQRNNSNWFQRRQEEGPFGAGSQGFGQGYRSGEGGMGGYTGFSSGGAESYYGGAGSSGQYRGYGSNQINSGDYGNQGRMGTYGNQSSGQSMGGYGGGSESQYGQSNWRQQQQGRFSGRGPKGYQRSDDRIKEDVCERLTHHGDLDASEIEVQVRSGEVTLTGSVDERNAKRMAEELAENVSGVKDVHNQIRVQDRSSQHSGANQLGSTSSQSSGSNQQSGSKELTGSQRK